MNLDKIPKTSEILDLVAMPVFLEGNEHGILMLHGFTGTPCELYYLGERLNKEGFTVSIPRLPGHGTNAKDFLQTNWKDWLRKAVDSYLELKYRCKTVNVIGLSMGALLSILLASNFDIQKLVLAAPALKVYDWRVKLTPFFAPLLGYLPKSSVPRYDYDGLNKIANEYWNKIWIKPAASFYKLQKMAKKKLRNLNSEIFVILSKNDRTVPLSVLEIFKAAISKEKLNVLILEGSSHVVTYDVEKELVADAVVDWFRDNP